MINHTPTGWAATRVAGRLLGADPHVAVDLEALLLGYVDAVPLGVEDAELGHVAARARALIAGAGQLGRHALEHVLDALHYEAEVGDAAAGVDLEVLVV